MDKPQPVENPDFSGLIQAVKDYMDYIGREDRHEDRDDDYENDVFEAAVTAVYGEKAFDYVNHSMKEYDKRVFGEEEE